MRQKNTNKNECPNLIVLKKTQSLVKKHNQGNKNLVDELIKMRRSEKE